jgi:hypothetical protein
MRVCKCGNITEIPNPPKPGIVYKCSKCYKVIFDPRSIYEIEKETRRNEETIRQNSK